MRDKEKAMLDAIIEKVNTLFEGEVSDNDKLVYVNNVIIGKLTESEVLREQAASNTKEQFANSPNLMKELINAVISSQDAHNTMSTQVLNSTSVQKGLLEILLSNAQLYEKLRELSGPGKP